LKGEQWDWEQAVPPVRSVKLFLSMYVYSFLLLITVCGCVMPCQRDYAELQRHFRAAHFLCEDTRCLAQRFVVFEEEVGLRAHVLASHPEQVRGFERGGSGFVGMGFLTW
jgi:hypothetical protein